MNFNYFAGICFLWALVGLFSRLAIVKLGQRWNEWEEHTAYTAARPSWLYWVDLAALLFIGFTWYQVTRTDLAGAWIIALLLTLILIKAMVQLFHYEQFRAFVQRVLHDKALFRLLNWAVSLFSLCLIALGVFYMR